MGNTPLINTGVFVSATSAGVGAGMHRVEETVVVSSSDNRERRRFIAGDVIPVSDAIRFGIVKDEVDGRPVNLPDNVLHGEFIAMQLRAAGYELARAKGDEDDVQVLDDQRSVSKDAGAGVVDFGSPIGEVETVTVDEATAANTTSAEGVNPPGDTDREATEKAQEVEAETKAETAPKTGTSSTKANSGPSNKNGK
jgi:hypothetical protein